MAVQTQTFYSTGVGGEHPERVTMKIVATVLSQDHVNNRSAINIKVYGYYNYHQYTPPNPTVGARYLKLNTWEAIGGTFNADFTGTSASNPTLLMEHSGTYDHNADGTKSFVIEARQNTPNVKTLYYLYGKHTWTLPTIPRMSLITAFPNFVIGGANGVMVTAPRESSAFTNIFELKIGSTLIKRYERSANSCQFTKADLDAIYALIPNSKSVTVTAYVTTKSGTTTIGTVQSKTAIATVGSDIKPTITELSGAETVSLVNALSLGSNVYVKNKSKPKFTASSWAGAKSSKITKCEIVLGTAKTTASITTQTSYAYTFGVTSASPTKAVARVQDSRGVWSDPKELVVSFVDYAEPKITEFTGFRATSNGTLNVVGTYFKPVGKGSISSVNSKNQLTYKIDYSIRGEGAYTTLRTATLAVGAAGVNTTDILGTGTTFSLDKSYDLRFTITDKLGGIATSYIHIGTGNVPFSFGKTGVGIGKIWEKGVLDVSGRSYFEDYIHIGSNPLADTIVGGITSGGATNRMRIFSDYTSRDSHTWMELWGDEVGTPFENIRTGWMMMGAYRYVWRLKNTVPSDGVEAMSMEYVNGKAELTFPVGGAVEASFLPSIIPEGSNLNNYQTSGMYYCPANATVATLTNTPTANAFSLFVEKHAGCKQTLTTYVANNHITYVRNKYDATWGDWVEMVYLVDSSYTTTSTGYTKVQKWSDGWMDVYEFNRRTTATAITTATGSMFKSATYVANYPVSFYDSNVIVDIDVQNGSDGILYTVSPFSITSSGCSYTYFCNGASSPTNLVTTYKLRGRWRA